MGWAVRGFYLLKCKCYCTCNSREAKFCPDLLLQKELVCIFSVNYGVQTILLLSVCTFGKMFTTRKWTEKKSKRVSFTCMLMHVSILSRSEGEARHTRGISRKKSARGRGFWSLQPWTWTVRGEFVLFWTLITSLGLGIWSEEMKQCQFPRLCPAPPPPLCGLTLIGA